uniref:Mitochondrial ribosomal protein L32 n=1 Tax=Acrobeloides nanus TaxID=290746 RepID=A0A914E0S7_9BILA
MRLTRLLLGVPKYRTSKAKKQTRKFGWTKLYRLNEYIVSCNACENPHDVRTICGTCYEGIHTETNRIKELMMKYNPYMGNTQQPYIEESPPERHEIITEKIEKKQGWFGWKT